MAVTNRFDGAVRDGRDGPPHPPPDATLQGKVLCGYQAWFNADGDGTAAGWAHWSHALPSGSFDPSFDLWPDTGELGEDELYECPLRMADGSPARLFSSCHPATVDLHFRWMQQHGIDGVFLQRFVSELEIPPLRAVRDRVAACVRRSAEEHGRVFCVMYDVSGASASSVLQAITDDWAALRDPQTGLTSLSNYVHHEGKPVLGLWGFGFADRPDPGAAHVLALIARLRESSFVVGGVPTSWRTGGQDALPGYGGIFQAYDCVSPWSVGRYFSFGGVDAYFQGTASKDGQKCADQGKGFAPVIWPGFSEANLRHSGRSRNVIPRHGGLFLWRQARQALALKPLFVYVAMFDELDEGTAIFKVAATACQAPPPQACEPGGRECSAFVTLDADRLLVPSDWYLRIVGAITALARSPADLAAAQDRLLPIACSHELEAALQRMEEEQTRAHADAARAVQAAYLDVLMREADPGGLAFYTDKVECGHSIEEVRQWMLDSPERALLMTRLRAEALQVPPPPPSALPHVLPRPRHASVSCDAPFVLTSATRIVVLESKERKARHQADADPLVARTELTALEVASGFAEFLGLNPPILCAQDAVPEESLVIATETATGGILTVTLNSVEGAEDYELIVASSGIRIVAASPIGALWALQTLRQLLPVDVEGGLQGTVAMQACRVEDGPRFCWRGSMLDCARHFMPLPLVKRHIEALSLLKVNVLHLHLVDDQGWRIEIEAFPRLLSSAWRRGPGTPPHGGFYSKQEIRELVVFARLRGVTIVPEIELPGHCKAALAAYPHLSCRGGPLTVEATWGVCDDVLCVGKEDVFAFLETVLTEVLHLFPSKYIHIGGDEVPATRWRSCPACQHRIHSEGLHDEADLYLYSIARVSRFLTKKGRVVVGWDEIVQPHCGASQREAQHAAGTLVQAWRGAAPAVAAAQQGLSVISSPTDHCYFDYEVSVTDLRKAYAFRPVPFEMPPHLQDRVIGGEFNMWTEYAPADIVETKIWPRGLAIAEVLWSGPGGHFDSFFSHVKSHHLPRLRALHIEPGPSFPPSWDADALPPHAVACSGQHGHGLRSLILRVGALVDQIEFVYRDGSVSTHSNNRNEDGGSIQPPFQVDQGEKLVRIDAHQDQSLYGVQFFLDSGRSSPLFGGKGGRLVTFSASPAAGIVDIERKSPNFCPPITGVVEGLSETPAV